MKLVQPVVEVMPFDPLDIMKRLELAGRVCYKSEGRITSDSAERFLASIVRSGHESVIEHCSISVKFIVDRGVTHELVRHRIGSYSQESTRYCNYSGGITFIENPEFKGDALAQVKISEFLVQVEQLYDWLNNRGFTPQAARYILPNGLKTEIVSTYNIREWRHVFKERCSSRAHPQMRQVMIPLLKHFVVHLPVLFEGIPYDEKFPEIDYATILQLHRNY